MSTRSNIAIKRKNGTIDSIYCHSDGYYEYNGALLNYFYRDSKKVNNLIDLGDISCLGRKVNPEEGLPHSFDYDKRQEGVTVAYHRDRGENLIQCNKRTYENMEKYLNHFKDSWEEFAYLYDEENKDWQCAKIPYEVDNNITFVPLSEKLEEIGKVYVIEPDKKALINKIMQYEKDNDHYEYLDSYESEEDAFFDTERVLSSKKGLENLIDIISMDVMELAKYEDMNDDIIKQRYNSGMDIVKDLNEYKNNNYKDAELDCEE